MCEDLSKDYWELAEQHSEELAQILDNFGESQGELLDHLMEIRSTQDTVPIAKPETAEVEGQSNNQQPTNPHESVDPTHNEQMQPVTSLHPKTVTAAHITQLEEDINTLEPTTQEGDVHTSPFTPGEGNQPRNDMAEIITPELNQDVCTEPSILDNLDGVGPMCQGTVP